MLGKDDERRRQGPSGKRVSLLAGGLLSGAAGFLIGAIFWVGLGVLSLMGGPLYPYPSVEDALEAKVPDCTSLALDRSISHTTAEPCQGHPVPLRREARAAPHGITAGPGVDPSVARNAQ